MRKVSKSLLFSLILLSLVIDSVATIGTTGCTTCRPSSLGTGTYPVHQVSNYGNAGPGNGFDSYTNIGSTLGSGYGSFSSGFGGDSLSSGGFGSSSSSSGYGFDLNSVIGGINSGSYNVNPGNGFNTNLGSLGIGNGVGLNTTGLNLGNMNPIGGNDASFILNTPSLTGTTFTNQFLNNANSNPGTITAVTTTSLPPTPTLPPTQTVTTITGIPSVPVTSSQQTVTTIKVKDETGHIIQVNGYDPTRTTQAVVVKNPIENFHIYKKVSSVNSEQIVRDTLNEGESMSEGEYLRSSNKAYYAVLQRDGNFVVYCSRVWISRNAIWNSQTAQRGQSGARRLTLTNAGNLVLYSGNTNNQLWASNSVGGSGPYLLIMQGDGNLVLYDRNRSVRWQTNTMRS